MAPRAMRGPCRRRPIPGHPAPLAVAHRERRGGGPAEPARHRSMAALAQPDAAARSGAGGRVRRMRRQRADGQLQSRRRGRPMWNSPASTLRLSRQRRTRRGRSANRG